MKINQETLDHQSETANQPYEKIRSDGKKKLPKPNLPSDEKEDERKQHHDQDQHQEGDFTPNVKDDDSIIQDDDETAGSAGSTLKPQKKVIPI